MMSGRENFAALTAEVRDYLQMLSDAGCQGMDCSPQSLEIIGKWGETVAASSYHGPETLESIREDLGDCQRCKLCQARRKIVFGAGYPKARLVFVGEGPGRDEDRSGEPFVGPAGKMLDNIIRAMGLTREQVYLCNIVKCRPPGNRVPNPDEIKTCLPFLKRQLDAIQPELICALGAVAAQTLLDTEEIISKLRGRFHDYHGIRLMPTFHPSYLLRNKGKKREVWEDIKKVMAEYGLPIPR